MHSPKRILVATDFSDTAKLAVDYGVMLAGTFNASLHVLHVLEDPLPGWKPRGHIVAVPSIREGMEQDAHEQIMKILSGAEQDKYHVERAVQWGKPSSEIIRYAKAHEIDLIVLGTHGEGPIMHLLLG